MTIFYITPQPICRFDGSGFRVELYDEHGLGVVVVAEGRGDVLGIPTLDAVKVFAENIATQLQVSMAFGTGL